MAITSVSSLGDAHSQSEWTSGASIQCWREAVGAVDCNLQPTLDAMLTNDAWQDAGHNADDDAETEAFLDEEFPLGDGVADLASEVRCPYCGEEVEITLDPGSGSHQQYVEDCYVCCRPWMVSVTYHEDGSAEVHVDANDAD